MANAEQERLAAAINEISSNELVQVGQEVSAQRGKMRVVMNTLMARVYSATNRKLEMHAGCAVDAEVVVRDPGTSESETWLFCRSKLSMKRY